MSGGMGITSAVTGAISSAIDAYKNNSEIMDTSSIESSIDDIKNKDLNYANYDSLMSDYNGYMPAYTNYNMRDLRGGNYGQMIGNTLMNAGSAAINGMASTGSPYGLLAGVPALAAGVGGIFSGDMKASAKADELNRLGEYANNIYTRNFANNASNIRNSTFNKAAINMAAFGGSISNYAKSRLLSKSFKMKPRKMNYGGFGHYYAYGGDMSGDWTNGIIEINKGGTHESNKYGGVPIGIDVNGTPNLVEEGEVVFNDYVYSNRLKPTKSQLESVNLDKKYNGLTYAELAKELQKESSKRPLDSISKNTLVDSMSKLTTIQEESRQEEMMKELIEALQQMTPEEQMGVMQSLPIAGEDNQQATPEEDYMYQPIEEDIPQGNRREYKYIQDNMDPSLMEQPIESAFGGPVNMGADGMNLNTPNQTTPIDVSFIRKKLEELAGNNDANGNLPYVNEFDYYKDGKYNDDYTNFVNNFKFDTDFGKAVYNELAAIYKEKFNKDLTPEKAKALGLDGKFGVFHDAWNTIKNHVNNRRDNIIPRVEPSPKYEEAGILQQPQVGINIPFNDMDVPDYPVNNDYPRMNALQYAPMLGSALSAINSLFEQPDYTAADYMARGRRGIRDVRGRAIGNYLTYNPYDINYASNKLGQIGLGATRAINNTAANAGQAIVGTLLQNNNLMGQLGDARMKAREYNDNQRKVVSDFNRQTDLQNAQFGQQADAQNSNLDVQRANLLAQEGALRDNVNTALSARRSSSITNLFNNLGNVGTQAYENDKLNWLFDRGWLPGMDTTKSNKCGGKIKRNKRKLIK